MIVPLLAVLALGVCLNAQHPDRSGGVGVVAFELNPPAEQAVLDLGVGVVRGACDWAALEPARGRFDWTCSDNVITGADRLGIRSYMTVDCTPAWASGGSGCSEMPTDVVDWYDFVTAFVFRYSRFNTILGVWNEPNLGTLRDTADASNYAMLFVNASAARNRVNARFVLAGPETSHHALASGYLVHAMDQIAAARAWNPWDIVSVHWYPDAQQRPPLLDYMEAIDGLAGLQDVWLSEVGRSTPDPQAQAAFYRNVVLTFAHADRMNWSHVVFYRLWDGQDCCSEALLNPDYSPKPAYEAVRAAIAHLVPRPPIPIRPQQN